MGMSRQDTQSIPWEIETAVLLGEASPAGFDELDVLMSSHQILKYLVENSLQVRWTTLLCSSTTVVIYKRAMYQLIIANSCSRLPPLLIMLEYRMGTHFLLDVSARNIGAFLEKDRCCISPKLGPFAWIWMACNGGSF